MDKKDITYIIAAFCIILVIAFVIKPIATGQPVNTGISFATPTPSITATPLVVYANITVLFPHHYSHNLAYTGPDMEPEGPDRWLCQSRNISSLHQPVPAPGYTINATQPDTNRTVYATISGKYSGTTQIINIPFPYWELSYTIDPMIGPMSGPQYNLLRLLRHWGRCLLQWYTGVVCQRQPAIFYPGHGCDRSQPYRTKHFTPRRYRSRSLGGITVQHPLSQDNPHGVYQRLHPHRHHPRLTPARGRKNSLKASGAIILLSIPSTINSYTIKILIPTRYIGKY